MPHTVYAAGNARFIAWAHTDVNGKLTALESREHAAIYNGKVSDEESAYVAVHVGLFWCIGTFRIKNGESVRIAVSPENAPSMFSAGARYGLAAEKTHFICELARQRCIKMTYEKTSGTANFAGAEIARLCAQ